MIDAAGSITDQQRVVRNVIAQQVQISRMELSDDEPV